MEKHRRASYKETSKQLNQKTIQMEDLRKKLDASKSRNKVLENEILQLKGKLTSLLDKSVKDEQVISTLTAQINVYEDREKAQVKCFSKMQENIYKLQQEVELEKTRNEQMEKALPDREKCIRRLELQLEQFRKQNRNLLRGDGGNKCMTLDIGVDKATETTAFSDKKFAEVERTRLLELLNVVNRRLEEARRQSIEAETQLRKEKCKIVKLETKIAGLELERVGAVKTGRGSYNLNKSDTSLSDADLTTQQQIEYLEEECLALKTRIATLQMEKEDDLKMFAAVTEMRDNMSWESEGSCQTDRLRNTPGKEEKISGRTNNKKMKYYSQNRTRNLSLTSTIKKSSFSSDETKSDCL